MSSAPPPYRPALRSAPGPTLAALAALLVVASWAWLARAPWSPPARVPSDPAPASLAGPSAAQPLQQPDPLATPVPAPARLAMPWAGRGASDLGPTLKLPATAIEVAQGLAYIGSGTVLQVVDVRDPREPRLLGRGVDPSWWTPHR